MGYMRALVELNNDTLQPVDRVTNTWHFRTPAGVAAAAPTVSTILDTFYTAFGGLFSGNLPGTGDITFYDLEDPTPRPPVATGAVSFTPAASSFFPNEVAIVLSFQGIAVAGLPQARRRGRIYVGPLAAGSGTDDAGDMWVTTTARNALAGAAEAVMTDTTLPGLIWSVFSTTTAGPGPWSAAQLDDAFITIVNGWCNNRFDTMRSRGTAPSSRVVFP